MEALQALYEEKSSRTSQNQIWSPFNWLPLFHKPNNWWTTTLDLSKLNQFLKVEKFKMETQETIKTFLQQGE